MVDGCAAGAAQARQQEREAEKRADLQTHVAHHHVGRLPVAYCVGGRQCCYSHKTSLLGSVLSACAAGPRSRGRGWRRCSSSCSRSWPHTYSDTGFELAVQNYLLWLEIQSSGPQLQQITRSPRSQPSLHGSASKHVHSRRACTRTHVRTRKLGCGTWRAYLGDSSHAAAGQRHSCCSSASHSKSATSWCCGGALEAAGGAYRRCCSPAGMRSHRAPWCATVCDLPHAAGRPSETPSPKPERWHILGATPAETYLPAAGTHLPATETSMSAATHDKHQHQTHTREYH
jgi:hypothetical protein